MKFKPDEILFVLTNHCNLNCPHCITNKTRDILPENIALNILSKCNKIGIKRIGFTGGEPFLALDLLCRLTKQAVKINLFFDRIMTNGVWSNDKIKIKKSLSKLYRAGYDGEICVSVDAFHKQNLKTVAYFIETAVKIWKRNDVVTIAYVSGAQENKTKQKLKTLAYYLKSKYSSNLISFCTKKIKPLFIRINKIDLSPIGKATALKKPWDGTWFREDYCQGPGNILLILPNGDVKPCCGYASDLKQLTIGNIKHDSVSQIIKNIDKNRFVHTIFNSGLSKIRERLEKIGIKFPGKTTNHCYFCYYILTLIDNDILIKCLN